MHRDLPIAEPAEFMRAPDWGTFEGEICCPLCGYNLRGLDTPRCPECGGEYLWEDLLDPKRGTHPYLFEHHPEQSVWAFKRTLIGGLKPHAFWSGMHPAQRCDGKRLLIYLLIVLLISAPLIFVATVCRDVAIDIVIAIENMPWGASGTVTSPTLRFNTLGSTFLSSDFLIGLVLFLGWPILTFLSLLIFQITIRKAKIRIIHLCRVIVYSGDFLLWFSAITLAKWIVIAVAKLNAMEHYSSIYQGFELNDFYVIPIANGVCSVILLVYWFGRPWRRFRLISVLAYISLFFLLGELTAMSEDSISSPFQFFLSSVMANFVSPEMGIYFIMAFSIKLATGLKEYLQIKRAFWMVASTQLIAALVVLNSLLLIHTLK